MGVIQPLRTRVRTARTSGTEGQKGDGFNAPRRPAGHVPLLLPGWFGGFAPQDSVTPKTSTTRPSFARARVASAGSTWISAVACDPFDAL